jgi:hypothetical protein
MKSINLKLKDKLQPLGKVKISRVFVNRANGQMTIILPKRKLKKVPKMIEVSYW